MIQCPNCNIKGYVTETGSAISGFTRVCHVCDNRWFVGIETLRSEQSHLTKRVPDVATCPRCTGNLNNDGYCVTCGYPYPPRR